MLHYPMAIYCKQMVSVLYGSPLQHAIAVTCVRLSISCVKKHIELATHEFQFTKVFCQISCSPYSPKFFTINVFYHTVYS